MAFESNFSIHSLLADTNICLENSETDAADSSSRSQASQASKDAKPAYTYSSLIVMAIRSSPKKRLTLSGICQWISENFSYYKNNKALWQNSIRHNLSISSYLMKVKRDLDDPGRGHYWTLSSSGEDAIIGESTGRLRRRKKSIDAGAVHSSTFLAGHHCPHCVQNYTPTAVYFPTPEVMQAQQSAQWSYSQQQQLQRQQYDVQQGGDPI